MSGDLPLHKCFNCGSDFVYPLDWEEAGHRSWRIVLRCPECESRREGVFDQPAVERLDDMLDAGTALLMADARRMSHSNMSEEVEVLARALREDLITADDFA